MTDFLKILVKFIDTTLLESNPLLEFFYDGVNIDTGELKTTNKKGHKITPCKKAYYKNLEFKIYNTNTVTISGSLHKYYNNGLHNYDAFNFIAFLAVLNDLKTKFNILPENCIIQNLEIGLNITPPTKSIEIINYCFLHKTKVFTNQINDNYINYRQCKHSHYWVKIYDKALQYKNTFTEIEQEILRFELKFSKMERLNKLGIFTLDDIVKSGFKIFENELITEWNNVLFFDNTIQHKSNRLLNYKNPLYWSELVNSKSKSNYYKHRELLKQYTLENSNQLQLQITNLMRSKINELSGV